jgi:subfamily B ATP-binding cassette protein MsbA
MEPKRDSWALYRRLLGHVKPYRARLILGVGFGALYGPVNAAVLGVVRKVWASVFEGGYALAPWEMAGVAALLPAVMVARGACDYVQTYLMNWVGQRVTMDLRGAVFGKMQSLSLDFFGEKRTGELLARVSSDVGLVHHSISTVVEDLVKQPITFLSVLAWLCWSNWRLAALGLVLFPVSLVPIVYFGRRTRQASRKGQQLTGTLLSVLHEGITGWRVVKVFCAEERELRGFGDLCRRFFRERMRVVRARAALGPLMEVVTGLSGGIVFVYAYRMQMRGSDLIAFCIGLFMLYEPIKKLSRVHLQIQEGLTGAERVFEVLDLKPGVVEVANARALPPLRQAIRFENVSFQYNPERVVLQDINLTVPAGSIVALVGASGAGKTTLLNLVPRFMDPTRGAVLVDGQDIRGVTFRSLREQMGLVTQETFLFNDTVAANIGYAKPGASREEIIHAARRAHAHEFIQQLPEHYDTRIGEAGMKLSGGQRQRLAIARAILKNPPILLLDEATSALDTESERVVQAALDALLWGDSGERRLHTMLVIAHRLSTVQHADLIVVLDQGRLQEQGTHTELLARGGLYQRLHALQFRT